MSDKPGPREASASKKSETHYSRERKLFSDK